MAILLGKSLEEIDRLSYRELVDWSQWFGRNPLPRFRTEAHLAQIAAMVHNANCGRGRGKGIAEFMLFEEDRPRREITDPEQMMAVLKALAGAS